MVNAWNSFITCHTIIRRLKIITRSLKFRLEYLTFDWILLQTINHDVKIYNKIWNFNEHWAFIRTVWKTFIWLYTYTGSISTFAIAEKHVSGDKFPFNSFIQNLFDFFFNAHEYYSSEARLHWCINSSVYRGMVTGSCPSPLVWPHFERPR